MAATSLTTRWRVWRHQRRSNRANIGYHYDVSNAFYRLWLDRQQVYSCAYFPTDDTTLDDAQTAKLEHICRKLRLRPGERFLDIGCGWGALLFRAAEVHGVDATGITLSKNQFDYVNSEIAARGLAGRVRVELRDYVDLPEDTLYDKIASVGMFEHVGVARFPKYFGKIRRILTPGGLVLNHGITHNPLGAHSLGSGLGDFVEDYVFPGGELVHVSEVIAGMAAQGLEVIDAEALREHYAKTLWHWCERLEANADAARAEVGEEKYRVWRIYLAGIGARVRPRLAVAVAAPCRQAAPRRPAAASADPGLHVRARPRLNRPDAGRARELHSPRAAAIFASMDTPCRSRPNPCSSFPRRSRSR